MRVTMLRLRIGSARSKVLTESVCGQTPAVLRHAIDSQGSDGSFRTWTTAGRTANLAMPDIGEKKSQSKPLDAIDRRILSIVQVDSSLSIGEIAYRVGLSQTPCWKRLQRLEQVGFIKRRVAVLDQSKLGLALTAFVTIEVADHSTEMQAQFAAGIAAIKEVMDCYRMAGDIDYMLRVVVPDTAAFDIFYKKLTALVPLKSVKSRFALEELKYETALPIPNASGAGS